MSPHDPYAAHRVYVDPPAAPAPPAPPALPEAIESPEAAFEVFRDLFASFGADDSDAESHAVEALHLADALAHGDDDKLLVALDAIRAGLVGEFEALAAIGVEVDAAEGEARAAELVADGVITMADLVAARWSVIEESATRLLSTPMAATASSEAATDPDDLDAVAATTEAGAATEAARAADAEPVAATADAPAATTDEAGPADEPQFDAVDPEPGPVTEPAAAAEEPTTATEATPAEPPEPATEAETADDGGDDDDPYVEWLRGQLSEITGKPADRRFGRARLESELAKAKAAAAGQEDETPAPGSDAD